jgi:hypothetical protein
MSITYPLLCVSIWGTLASYAASKTGRPTGDALGADFGRNNVVNSTSKNTRFSNSKTDGVGTLIFKGSNNIISIDITDSDIAAFNTKTVTIIEGDNNNLTSVTRKCVLVYKGRRDTLIIKGNQLKIDFTADHVLALIDGPGRKQEITTGQDLREFSWPEWKSPDDKMAVEEVFVEASGEYLTLPKAFAYYSEQARNANYQACYMLGRFFDNLTADTLPDIPKAIEYYELAARHNQAEAAFRLGHIYEVGDFEFERIAINRPKALYYYRLAAQNGSEPALEKLKLWEH